MDVEFSIHVSPAIVCVICAVPIFATACATALLAQLLATRGESSSHNSPKSTKV